MSIEKKSFRSGPFKDFIANAVQVDNVLYISGQVGLDDAGNVPDSFAEQTQVAYSQNLVATCRTSSMRQYLSQT